MSGSRIFSRVILAWFALSARATAEAPVALVERSFSIQHRSVDEAYQLVAPLLSALADVRVVRAEARLSVRDQAAIVERVALELRLFDVPPHQVRVSVRVVRGERREVPGAELASAHDAGIPPNVGKLLRYNTYDLVGEVELAIAEESSGMALLGRDGTLRIEAKLGRVSLGDGSITLERLSLAQRRRDGEAASASEAIDRRDAFRTLIAWTEELHDGRSRVLFATPGVNDRRALFVIIQAKVVRP